MLEALIGFAAFLALAFLSVPMAFAMGIVGFFGVAYKVNFNVAVGDDRADDLRDRSGLYAVGHSALHPDGQLRGAGAHVGGALPCGLLFLGHLRGGLAMSTVVACAGFGAICGSSIATAATFTKVAYPSMRKFGYKDALAAGSIAAGGTLGILIPPSVIMVIYGIMTETSIGKLFVAGIIPAWSPPCCCASR